MGADKKLFFQQSYEYARWALNQPQYLEAINPAMMNKVCRYGAAQACLESNYGRSRGYLEHNNPLGIKPVDDQPGEWPIRTFNSVGEAWRAWAYLVCESEHYNQPRTWIKKGKPYCWFLRFSQIYCPEDKDYWRKVSQIEKSLLNERVIACQTKN